MKTSYTLRLPEELRKKIKEEAERSDMSVNQYILYTLQESTLPYRGPEVTGIHRPGCAAHEK